MSSTERLAPSRDLDLTEEDTRSIATIAVAGSLVAIGITAVYWASRIGFLNPAGPLLRSIGLGLFVIAGPGALKIALRRRPRRWVTSHGFLTIVALTTASLAGWVSPRAAVDLFLPFGLLGTVSFGYVLLRWLRTSSVLQIVAIVTGATIFVIWTSGVVWGRIYKSPLFLEMMAVDGIVHHDELYQSGLSNMVGTYGSPSIGVDGLAPIRYHWGSNWVFAQLSHLVSLPVIVFYQLTFAVTMIPLFFATVLNSGLEVRRLGVLRGAGDNESGAGPARRLTFWTVFIAATIGIMPIAGMDAFGVWSSNLMISESYTIAIPAGLLVLTTVAAWWHERGWTLRAESGPQPADLLFLWLLLPGALIGLGYLKVSLMILALAALCYAALRLGLFRRWQVVVAALISTALSGWTYRGVSAPSHHEGYQVLDFLKGFVPLEWWQFFFLFHLFWPLVYTVVRLRQERIATLGDLGRTFRTRGILDVEIVVVVAIIGVVPGLILHIDGGSAFYISDVQRWLALALLLALVPGLARTRIGGTWPTLKMVALALLSLPFVFSTARNTVHWAERMLRANAATRHALYPPELAASIVPRIRSLPQLADPVILRDGLYRSRNFRMVSELIRLGGAPFDDRRRTALFIPQSERAYWALLARPGACTFAGFIAPSLAATAMIDGMPGPDCELNRYYGLAEREPRKRMQVPDDTEPAALCSRAKQNGLDRVVVVRFSGPAGLVAEIECS